MKKFCLFLISLLLILPIGVNASEKVIDIHLFYSLSCPHCKEEKEYLTDLANKDKTIKIHLYEVTQNEENSQLLDNVQKLIDGETPYVPYTVIGSKYRVGFNNSTKSNLIFLTFFIMISTP